MSKDENMITSYQHGKDLYATMGVSVYKNKYEDNLEHNADGTLNPDGKKRRGNMKVLLLGITYQMGANSIATSLNTSVKEAQEIVDNFYKGFPKIKAWMDDTKEFCKKNGYVEDYWGRRRRLPDILLSSYDVKDLDEKSNFNPLIGSLGKVTSNKSSKANKYLERLRGSKSKKQSNAIIEEAKKDNIIIKDNGYFISQAERQCINARIQGSAATLTKIAMIKIYNDQKLKDMGYKLSIAVHDELIGECPEEYAEECAKRVSELMISAASDEGITCPMKCDPEIEKNWYTDEYFSELEKERIGYIHDTKAPKTPREALRLLVENHEETKPEDIYKHYAREDGRYGITLAEIS